MKKTTFLFLLLFIPLLMGFEDVKVNTEEIIGKGEKHNTVIISEEKFKGKEIKSIEVPNDIIKQNRIYAATAGEESVTGGNSNLGIIYWNQYTNWYVYDMLSDRDKKLWDNLDILYQPYLLTDKEYTEEISLIADGYGSYQELFKATYVYLYCHPQYYFLRPNLYGYKINNSYGVSIEFYNKFKSGEERAKTTHEIKEWLNKQYSIIGKENSDFKRYKKIHDIVCNQVYYDYDVVKDDYDWDNDDHYSQTIYSAICMGKTVCAGYAKLYECLCNRMELNAVTLNGSGHAWNIVYLEDEWYYIDSTWDDSRGSYYYFLVNQKKFEDNSHSRNEQWNFIPDANNIYLTLRSYKGNSYYGSTYVWFDSYMITYYLGKEDDLTAFNYNELTALPTSFNTFYYNKLKLPKKISRIGYKFNGWYLNDEKVKELKGITKDLEIEAKWKPINYSVSFVKGTKGIKAKSVKGNMKSIKVDYDTSIKIPNNQYELKGYRFKGWSTDKNSTEVQYKNGAIISNLSDTNKIVKLYAVWEKED